MKENNNCIIAYGIFSTVDNSQKRVGIKILDIVVDLSLLLKNQLIILDPKFVCNDKLNPLIEYLMTNNVCFNDIKSAALSASTEKKYCYQLDDVITHMPIKIRGFTDFYSSEIHAANIGKIFRPDNPLMPNWKHMPIAYNGRASSVRLSSTPLIRPRAQIAKDGKNPVFSSCQKLDFEVELGVVIAKNSTLGVPININQVEQYVFGICVVNDWSARDIQAWEYQPLGPFNAKSFLTSISPWIIPLIELNSYKIALNSQIPQPMDYLRKTDDYLYDIELEVSLKTSTMKQGQTIVKTNFKAIYWSINQWIAQHTITGCNLEVGDLIASGTISSAEGYGSLMELTNNGTQALQLYNGETRTFLEDGDTVTISASCAQQNLGEVTATIQGR